MTQSFEEPPETVTEISESDRPNLLSMLILLLLIIALLTSLMWPLLRRSAIYRVLPPTPTPLFLQEAYLQEWTVNQTAANDKYGVYPF